MNQTHIELANPRLVVQRKLVIVEKLLKQIIIDKVKEKTIRTN